MVGYGGCINSVPSAVNLMLLKASFLKPGVGQIIALHTTPTVRNSVSVVSALQLQLALRPLFCPNRLQTGSDACC